MCVGLLGTLNAIPFDKHIYRPIGYRGPGSTERFANIRVWLCFGYVKR